MIRSTIIGLAMLSLAAGAAEAKPRAAASHGVGVIEMTNDGRLIARAAPASAKRIRVARKGVARAQPVARAPSMLDNIRSVSGASARVAAGEAWRFQCVVDWLDSKGYRIDALGGYRPHGSIPQSKHPLALALDINQERRNVVTRPFPAGYDSAVKGCGLINGANWRGRRDARGRLVGGPDNGHVEVAGRHPAFARARRPTRLAAVPGRG